MTAFRRAELQSPRPFAAFTPCRTPCNISAVDHVARPTFDLVEDQSDILADHAEKEKLDPAEKAQGGDQRRPAGHIHSAERVKQELDKSSEDAEAGNHQSKADAEPQRHLGKRADPVEREAEERRGPVIGTAARPRRRTEWNIGHVEAEPPHE